MWIHFDSDRDTTAPFTAFYNYLIEILRRVLLANPVKDELEEAFDGRNHPWSQHMDVPSGLLGRIGQGETLLEQITKMSAAESVTRLTVCSPYFDDTGSALNDLIQQLKPVKADILIQQKFPRLSKAIVKNLPPHAEIVPIEFTRKDMKGIERESFIHAKFYGITYNTNTLLIAGSANCSRAALTIPGNGGNAELLALQRLTIEQFNELYLAEIPRVSGTPDFLDTNEDDEPQTMTPSIRILAARYDDGLLRIGFLRNQDIEIVHCSDAY